MSVYMRRIMPPRPPASIGIEERNPPALGGQLKHCDRCYRAYQKDDLLTQEGLQVCARCFDEDSYKEPEAE